MTTLNVTLEDSTMVSALRRILLHLNGVKDVTVVSDVAVEVPNVATRRLCRS